MQRSLHYLQARAACGKSCKSYLSGALLFMLIIALLAAPKQANAQEKSISISADHVPLATVLKRIEEQSGYRFFYNANEINVQQQISIKIENALINEALQQLFSNRGISYQMRGDGFEIALTPLSTPGARSITGRVVNTQGAALSGATIRVKESQQRTMSDMQGAFLLSLSSNDKVLIVSYVGMRTREVVIGNQDQVSVIMQPDEDVMEEVAVTGYQTLSKKDATGAYAVINPATTLQGKLQTNIISRLEGQIAGMVQNKNKIAVRGIATLRGDAQPLIVVDGMPFEGNINTINPSIITNITLLKDAAASSIYGAKAANGVLVITTKQGQSGGKTQVRYDGNVRVQPIPDFSYLNRLSSAELVDIQEYGFKFQTNNYSQLNPREALNPVEELLYKRKADLITEAELQQGLNKYRNLDNMQQVKDFFLRTALLHQHNITLSGGNEWNRYAASGSYMGNYGNARYSTNEMYGFTLRDDIKFFKWMSGMIGVAANVTKTQGDDGMGSYSVFITGTPSYIMLRDEQGNPLHVPQWKSDYELERLRSIGLKDETYSPITNRQERNFLNTANYGRLQIGLNFLLLKGLDLDVKYQTERSFSRQKMLYKKNDYYVRNMINDAAEYNADTKELKLNIPDGGQVSEYRGEQSSYTLRTQLNYSLQTNVHTLTALAGAERRAVKNEGNSVYKLGYDDNTLSFKEIDENRLSWLYGTQALNQSFFALFTGNNFFDYTEDRFVSFYGNSAYTYKNKYGISGSIRMDQSNLFGTDPRNQYRPLWSLGAAWHIDREDFMKDMNWLNQLKLRATYGIGGNVPKNAGPFLTLQAPYVNSRLGEFSSRIENPPNPLLRWEKTATTNLGLDFAVLKNTLSGSIDVYRKYSTDLLAYRNADPTLGFDQLMLNYGSMVNRGIEISLNSRNIESGGFRWTSAMTFAINKSKLIDVDDSRLTIYSYTGSNTAAIGYPMESVFSFRYAGLDNQGKPLFYNAQGEKVTNITNIKDLVYSGTRIPVRSGSLTNTLSYKNFSLMAMLVYYGGHVLRADAAPILAFAPTRNVNRQLINMWRVPGDELNPNTTPGLAGSYMNMDYQNQWYASDRYAVNASYIKLRDVSLIYSLDNPWLHKKGINSASLIVQAQNLWRWAANNRGIDPEAMETVNNGYGERAFPIPKSWTIGLSLQF